MIDIIMFRSLTKLPVLLLKLLIISPTINIIILSINDDLSNAYAYGTIKMSSSLDNYLNINALY